MFPVLPLNGGFRLISTRSKNDRVKILGGGTLSMPLEVTAHAFSKSAVAAIEAQQGKVVKL